MRGCVQLPVVPILVSHTEKRENLIILESDSEYRVPVFSVVDVVVNIGDTYLLLLYQNVVQRVATC